MSQKKKQFIILFVLVAILLALPASALANKRPFKARMTTDAELHQVTGSNAAGNATFVVFPGSMRFRVALYGLSGPVSGVHIHGPATTSENGPILVTLCGSPGPAAVPTCDVDSDGNLVVEGEVTSSLLGEWGLPQSVLLGYMDSELTYVNAHTSLNPMGEARGQIYPR